MLGWFDVLILGPGCGANVKTPRRGRGGPPTDARARRPRRPRPDRLARTAIQAALDATIVGIAADAWLGRLPSSGSHLPTAA